MVIKVNCKHYNGYGGCKCPEMRNRFRIFAPNCLIYDKIGGKCALQSEYPRPAAPPPPPQKRKKTLEISVTVKKE